MTKRAEQEILRIRHTIPSIAELSAGPTYSVMRLCETLISLGQDVSLSVLDAPNHRPVPGFVERFPVEAGGAKLGNSASLFRSLRRTAASGLISALHSHNLWMMPAVYPGWIARIYGIPVVCSPRGALAAAAFGSGSKMKVPFWSIVQRPALKWVTCFHATAETEVEDIRRHGFRQPIALIPNGIDVPELVRTASKHRTLLYLGRIHPNKQVDMLVRAWACVEQDYPEWRLRIVGPDNDAPGFLERMRELARSLRLARISFEGERVGEEKLAAYRSADAYVLPTKSENFGITIAEALAAGTPVITTKGAPWPQLEMRGAGWWIEHGEEPLVRAIRQVLSTDRELLETMGSRGRDWMRRDYAWSNVAMKMLDLYKWLAAESEPADRPLWVKTAEHPGSGRERKS
jgi:glycosyltransferase involved in cell wall biosynthesis